MAILDGNPFSVLTFIAALAILTNASSVMALGTSNRFARVVDRGRMLAKSIQDAAKGAGEKAREEHTVYLRMLTRNEKRGELLVQALRGFYLSLGSFAAASLLSLLGAIFAVMNVPYVLPVMLVLALIVGVCGVTGLVGGCFVLVRETALAQANLRDESELVRHVASV